MLWSRDSLKVSNFHAISQARTDFGPRAPALWMEQVAPIRAHTSERSINGSSRLRTGTLCCGHGDAIPPGLRAAGGAEGGAALQRIGDSVSLGKDKMNKMLSSLPHSVRRSCGRWNVDKWMCQQNGPKAFRFPGRSAGTADSGSIPRYPEFSFDSGNSRI